MVRLSAAAWLSALALARAATVTYDFNITWVNRSPDGFARPVIGINGQWPIPEIRCQRGDAVVVNVNNQLGNQSVSLHFHGIFHNGTTHMDGASGVGQCPIPSGSRFTYNFTIDQPGTYWYHSHNKGQYPDGLRGPLIVEDPDSPYKGQYDEERVLTLSDWYHDQMPTLIKRFQSIANPTGAEPVPNTALINDQQNYMLPVKAGKTYMLRIINVGAFAGQYFWIDSHKLRIVEVDGVYTEAVETDKIYLTAAQRYSVLVTMQNSTANNFAFTGSMDQDLFDAIPNGLNPNVTGWLVYDDSKPKNPAPFVDNFDYFDDATLVPTDKMPLLTNPDVSVQLDVVMDMLGDGSPYAFFNNITYVSQKVPTLYSALTTGQDAMNPLVYSPNVNPFVLKRGQIVEIVLNNLDTGKHPFHLHGHNFQVIHRSEDDAGVWDASNKSITFPSIPMRRDVIMLHPTGNTVLRYRADNPGVWLFHCHIEWHMIQGLIATFVEAPLDLQKTISIPENHYDSCRAQNIPIAGNAAGNTQNVLDLSMDNEPHAPLPGGFTARGIVALVFSVIAAFLGMAVIAWYGVGEIGSSEVAAVERTIAAAK